MNWTKYSGLFKVDTGREKVRQFGFILAGFLAFVGTARFIVAGHTPWNLVFAGVIVGSLAAILPRFLVVIYYPWMIIANLIGFTITHLILIILFYIILTPIGLIRRVAGKDSLERKYRSGSYWIARDSDDQANLERMF